MTARSQLIRFTDARRKERNRRILAIGRQIDVWTRGLEDRILGIVAANRGGREGVQGSIDAVLLGTLADASVILDRGLRSLWSWSWDSAVRAFIRAVPMRIWVARNAPILTPTEAGGASYSAGGLHADIQVQKILDRKVSDEEARSIVREIEFPPPPPDRVEQILAATNADDGLSAMERIKTVLPRDLDELRQIIVTGVSEVEGADAVAGIAKRIRPIVGNDPGQSTGMNYRAKRIARTEGVRIAEAGLRETWERTPDLLDGIKFVNAHVPRSRESHQYYEGDYFRSSSGEYIRSDGEHLPQIPLGPNCLCWTEPILAWENDLDLPPRNLGLYNQAKRRSEREIAALRK